MKLKILKMSKTAGPIAFQAYPETIKIQFLSLTINKAQTGIDNPFFAMLSKTSLRDWHKPTIWKTEVKENLVKR